MAATAQPDRSQCADHADTFARHAFEMHPVHCGKFVCLFAREDAFLGVAAERDQVFSDVVE
jgi:hypothetical protein